MAEPEDSFSEYPIHACRFTAPTVSGSPRQSIIIFFEVDFGVIYWEFIHPFDNHNSKRKDTHGS